jgi:hypothetical protein
MKEQLDYDPNAEIEAAMERHHMPSPIPANRRRADFYDPPRPARYLDAMRIRILGPATDQAVEEHGEGENK